VHDRRIDGTPHTFGNAGALFMTAMTWYDHETGSIWSQPWGRAIQGPLKGVELFLLPSRITSWGSWVEEHPGTLAMINDVDRLGSARQGFQSNFVIGLLLAEQAKAYYFSDVRSAVLLNDWMGPYPVLLWAEGDQFHAYIRQVGTRTLRFEQSGDRIIDLETGSVWDIGRGRAVEGPLAGDVLQPVPGSSAYDWAWFDFYPESALFVP
jgi:hypothetical protein